MIYINTISYILILARVHPHWKSCLTRFHKTGTSTAVHQRSKTGDIVEAYRTEGGCGKGQINLFREGGKAPLPLQRVSRPFSLGPGPARAPLMEAEGYSRRALFVSRKNEFS